MAGQESLVRAGPEYDEYREHVFRRELESYLFALVGEINQISSGNNTGISLYSKREQHVSPPVGIVSIV